MTTITVTMLLLLLPTVTAFEQYIISREASEGRAVLLAQDGGELYLGDGGGVVDQTRGVRTKLENLKCLDTDQGVTAAVTENGQVVIMARGTVQSKILITAEAVKMVHPMLYVATKNSTLEVYDLRDVAVPKNISSETKFLGLPVALSWYKSTLYVATDQAELHTFSATLVYLKSVRLPSAARHITFYGSWGYVSTRLGVFQINVGYSKRIVVSNLKKIHNGGGMSSTVSGSTLYVAAGRRGLQVFDIQALGELDFVTSFESVSVFDVAVVGELVYLAAGEKGFIIVKTKPCSEQHPSVLTVSGNVTITHPQHGDFIWDRNTTISKIPRDTVLYTPQAQPITSTFTFSCPDTCDQTPCEIILATTKKFDFSPSGWTATSCTPKLSPPQALYTFKQQILPGGQLTTPDAPQSTFMFFFHKTGGAVTWCEDLEE